MTTATLPFPLADAGTAPRAHRLRDVVVLAGRNLVHIAREPMQLSDVTIQPVLFTLLFIYVFGSAVAGTGGSYAQFAVAGLLTLNLTTSSVGTAIGLSTDLSTGVIDRFRTLPMWRPAVLVGRSAADLLSALLCAAIVTVTGLVVGWRPEGGVGEAIAAFGVFMLFSYALSWVCACIGLASKSPESAQGIAFIAVFPLTFVSNTIVPTMHMPTVVRAIADWNPVSAVTTAARQLWHNPNPAAAHAWPMQHPVAASLLWSAALLAVFVPLAVRLYRRRTVD